MAEHLLRVTATDNAVLCYLHLTPSVAKLYGINSCGGNTSIGVMLLQVLEALGASVEWYERVPQLSCRGRDGEREGRGAHQEDRPPPGCVHEAARRAARGCAAVAGRGELARRRQRGARRVTPRTARGGRRCLGAARHRRRCPWCGRLCPTRAVFAARGSATAAMILWR